MYSLDELREIKKSIVSELNNAAQNKPSSYPFIRHVLSKKPHVKLNEVFQVMVIGGTVFKTALVKKTITGTEILEQSQEALPLFDTEIIFLEFLSQRIRRETKHLALNFAYPVNPVNREDILDGTLISGSKEHQFKDLVGKTIGQEVEKYFFDKTNQKIQVTLANDTICLLLSGLTKSGWENLAAGVVGTGLNFAIYLKEYEAINIEAARFNKFLSTKEGKKIDENSQNPHQALFEKEISGAYLFQHYNIVKGFNKAINSTEELNTLANDNDEDAQKVLERSASLVAVQMAGIMEFLGKDLHFIMQGSLFWNGYNYRRHVMDYMNNITTYKYECIDLENADIIGSIILCS